MQEHERHTDWPELFGSTQGHAHTVLGNECLPDAPDESHDGEEPTGKPARLPSKCSVHVVLLTLTRHTMAYVRHEDLCGAFKGKIPRVSFITYIIL